MGVGGIERDTYTDNDNDDRNDEIEAISRNQQEVVDFYYKIKEYFLEHTELCSRVPAKRTTWSDVDTDAGEDDDNEPDANTELNMKISDAMLCPPPTAPIPIPPPNPNYYSQTAITEPKN